MALFRRADEVGFDWVTVAEHHYSPVLPVAQSDGAWRGDDPGGQEREDCASGRDDPDPQPDPRRGGIRDAGYHERRSGDRRQCAARRTNM